MLALLATRCCRLSVCCNRNRGSCKQVTVVKSDCAVSSQQIPPLLVRFNRTCKLADASHVCKCECLRAPPPKHTSIPEECVHSDDLRDILLTHPAAHNAKTKQTRAMPSFLGLLRWHPSGRRRLTESLRNLNSTVFSRHHRCDACGHNYAPIALQPIERALPSWSAGWLRRSGPSQRKFSASRGALLLGNPHD